MVTGETVHASMYGLSAHPLVSETFERGGMGGQAEMAEEEEEGGEGRSEGGSR